MTREGLVRSPEVADDDLDAMTAEFARMMNSLHRDMGGDATVLGLPLLEPPHEDDAAPLGQQLENAWRRGYIPTLLVRTRDMVFAIRAYPPGEKPAADIEAEPVGERSISEQPAYGMGRKLRAMGKTAVGATKAVFDDASRDAGVVAREVATILGETLDDWVAERYQYKKMEWDIRQIKQETPRDILLMWERVDKLRTEYHAATNSRIVVSHNGFETWAKKIIATEQALQARLLEHYGCDVPPIYRRQLGR